MGVLHAKYRILRGWRPCAIHATMASMKGAWVLVGVVLASGQVRAEPPCIPVVRISGEPALVQSVMGILVGRGIPVSGASKCGRLGVIIEGAGERTRLTIVDPEGQTVERVADDPTAAATAIESWARRDLAAPLLAAREAPRATMDREAPPAIAVPAERETRPIEVAAAFELGRSRDGADWMGARAQACVQLGSICAGALVRYAADRETGGDSIRFDSHRSMLDLMLAADLPIPVGRFTFTPGVAFGQSSLRVERRAHEREKVPGSYVGLRGHLAAGVRIAGAWSMHLDLAVGAAPFAPRTVEEISFSDETPEPTEPPPLAGLPRTQGWVGFGLVYGGL